MCNRYSQTKGRARMVTKRFGEADFTLTPRYNIAPSQVVDVVWLNRGKLELRTMAWGWSHKKYGRITNAQAETATQKMFMEASAQRRCLVPADGYYEWLPSQPPQPYRMVLASGKLFWFAGLYQEGEVLLLTGPSGAFMTQIHDRLPLAIPERELDWWLGEAKEWGEHSGWGVIRRAIEASAFEAYPVTKEMNRTSFEDPACVEPVAVVQRDLFGALPEGRLNAWNDVSDPPMMGTMVSVLLADDTTTTGTWDGRAWAGPWFGESRPVKWRTLEGDKYYLGANGRSA